MKQRKFLFLLTFFMFLFSCERDNFFDPEFYGDGVLLQEVKAEGETYYRYTYNEAGFVLEEKSKFHYTNHTYNSKNQLIQSDYYWDTRIASSSSYVLDEAIKRTEWVSPENTERDTYTTYEYSSNGQLQKSVSHRSINDFAIYNYENDRIAKRTSYHENKPSVLDKYDYDYAGNLIKVQRFYILANGSEELTTTTEYEFDDKHNPYFPFRKLMIPGKHTNPNNITKETYTLHFEVDAFIEPIQVTEYSYEYNLLDYPAKRSDGFEYIYN